MRQTAPAWAKTLLTVLLLVHLLIHPSLHALPFVADGLPEFSSPGSTGGDAAREGRAPCLACRIGSSVAGVPLAVELVGPQPLAEEVPFLEHRPCARLDTPARSPRAPPLASWT